MRNLLLAAAILSAPVAAQAQETPAPTATPKSAEPVKGSTRETAYKVKSIDEEYSIMRKLGLQTGGQSLIIADDGHPYDVLDGIDPNTGEKREIWFDIKSFFGKEF